MEDHPLVQLHPIAIQLATVPAVAIASYKALNVWRAVSALPLNPHSSGPDAPATPSPTSEALKQWRALTATKKAKKIAAFLICFSLGLGFHFFMVYGLAKISSQFVMDAIWTVILVAMYTGSIRYASDIALPTPRSVRYHRAKPDAPMTIAFGFDCEAKMAFRIEVIRLLLSVMVAGGITYSTWAGYTYFHPILGAAYVTTIIATLRFPLMSVRRIIQVLSGYLILAPPLSIAIGLLIDHFSGGSENKESAESEEKEGVTIASDWVLSLLFVFSDIFGAIVPSVITAMTLRFEYSLVNEPVHRPTETSTDAPVRIPNEYPSFPKPIFLSSLFALLSSQILINMITFVFPDIVWLGITPLNVYISIPIVFGGTACAAAYFGKLGQWWRYTEVWIPSKKSTDSPEEGHKDTDEEDAALLPMEGKETA
ncbi:uncharacterized protein I303_103293 [Kwoniella dejecticola CBS 10117]|uniref:Uncharacterized protein n=1 Tax=Kwoniella dejecticola CBS 10117 TaxID=1296121 RepID=A0A1A6A6C9_9TREE|nr:uncharacterized protein I303_03316 [Kwoniella dejecticola CBS 10117]OBR85605.1 hypothetical protein I303_03316 [Kwoniella dejecticola CBS 10117]